MTTGSGLTLYRFTADPMGKSVCTGACAKIWPPLTASKGEHVQGPKGVKGLSVINVGHGRWQVAFHNVALYRFTGDTKKGQAHGQDVAHMWFAVLKSGIPASASTPTTAALAARPHPSTSTTQTSSGAVTPVTPSTHQRRVGRRRRRHAGDRRRRRPTSADNTTTSTDARRRPRRPPARTTHQDARRQERRAAGPRSAKAGATPTVCTSKRSPPSVRSDAGHPWSPGTGRRRTVKMPPSAPWSQ